MSLKGHAMFIAGILSMIFYVTRTDDDLAYRFPTPPVDAPPPLPLSMGYSLSKEVPYWSAIETEEQLPAHVPQRPAQNVFAEVSSAVRGSPATRQL